eukprot:6866235-Pyramimonas_sp.AAC.1
MLAITAIVPAPARRARRVNASRTRAARGVWRKASRRKVRFTLYSERSFTGKTERAKRAKHAQARNGASTTLASAALRRSRRRPYATLHLVSRMPRAWLTR